MTLRCWLLGHQWGAPVDTDYYTAESERSVKCIRCGKIQTTTYKEGVVADD